MKNLNKDDECELKGEVDYFTISLDNATEDINRGLQNRKLGPGDIITITDTDRGMIVWYKKGVNLK